MKVAFLVNDLQLSGGVGVVVAHARQLAAHHGFDVTLVLVREQEVPHWGYESLEHLHVATLAHAREQHFDVAVATWWETTFSLYLVPAGRYAYFVQSLEDRFYRPDEAESAFAGLTLDLPLAFITEARWIARTLRELRPDAPVHLVRNGIDKTVFASPPAVEPNVDGPLRILVEGYPTVWFKGVNAAIAATRLMAEQHELTVVAPTRAGLKAHRATRVIGPLSHRDMAAQYGRTDVVLKLSSVEGMFGPPLEGFHLGATCVTTEVTGYDEYVEHGYNGLLVDWDDPRGTARQLDLLARDRRLLHVLRSNALETARRWPTWEQQGQFMAGALRRIHREPPPAPYAGARALTGDLRAAIERDRILLQERSELQLMQERMERFERLPGIRHALRVRAIGPMLYRSRAGRLLLARVWRPVKRRLLGP
ncbi:MAG TPA: glycosyltransferase family 4 protein [Solirubrobacteraceae bacterium]|nr:glycosyltransferase family 4 protein [Solirubrobacteraceae bacterium]